MADFELNPEAVVDAAQTQAAELEAGVQEVAAQAAALDMAQAFDFAPEFAPEEKKKEDVPNSNPNNMAMNNQQTVQYAQRKTDCVK